MEETVGPVSTRGRELLRGWWRPISFMASFTIFTALVRSIFDGPLYIATWKSRELLLLRMSRGLNSQNSPILWKLYRNVKDGYQYCYIRSGCC
jgi:hypothetical protein